MKPTTSTPRPRWPAALGAAVVGYCALAVATTLFAGASRISVPGPGVGEPGCVTSGCHEGYTDKRFVHGPVALGMCLSCHTIEPDSTPYQAGADHLFDVVERDGHLCERCHESQRTEANVHYPMDLFRCLPCHDPHGSDNPGMMREEHMVDTCYGCHEPEMDDDDFVHAPVRAGACTICHDPHGSPYPKALVAPGPQVCFKCHTEMARKIDSSAHAHRPVLESCTACHSPHDAYYPALLNDTIKDLCLSCHEDMAEHIEGATRKHGALEGERSCVVCHDPHASEFTRQLVASPIDLCLSCHDREMVAKDSVLPDMAAFLAQNPERHGPVREGDCAACHNPHGSDNPHILQEPYPKNFYAPFELERYKLCFSCHEQSLVLDERTETLTGFRNGDLNLHFVHVNREKKGRSCRSCHDVHASRNPKHIADTVPFGAWRMPIGYEQTIQGGSCSPGCHAPRDYDWLNPAEND
jgi:predicted CXXCH cytochrome family protein